jgi:nitroimidazol reductase NimA-like FMN-containing flavoprotein (pyridoxamine 5'-phosphate oxidase superfamily)
VCGTVIEDLGYGHGECEHYYRSIIIRGKIHLVDDPDEKRHGIDVMIKHLEEKPDDVKARLLKDEKTYARFHILRLDIEEITGKGSLLN